MVYTFGNSIVGAFTNGSSVNAIYTYGEKVWPDGSTPSGSYYIKWWPKSASGVFIIGGQARYLEDYNGYYSGPFLSSSIFSLGFGYHMSFSSSVYYIDSSAFQSTSIIGVETNLKYVEFGAFEGCSNLRYVSMPEVAGVSGSTFANCSMLYEVEMPKLKQLTYENFNNCTYLHYASFPEVSWMGAEVTFFSNCSSLIDVYLPKCRWMDKWALAWCGISSIELPSIARIGDYCFRDCSNLQTIVLPGSSIPMIGENVFSGTKMYTSSARIYVPISMLLDYKSAWAGVASIIYPIPHS